MNKFWVGALIVVLLACGKDDAPAITDVDTTITAWLDSSNVSAIRDDSGIYYYSLDPRPTATAVTPESVVSIYYTLWSLDSTVIASHQPSDGDSLQMKHGVSAIYPVGLDIGLSFMREGETYRFIIPPSLGYSGLTSGAIDPDLIAMLDVQVVSVVAEGTIFTQELADIDDYILSRNLNDTIANPIDSVELFTSGVAYKRVRIGMGPAPLNGDTIIVDYAGRFLDDTPFGGDMDFEFAFGSNFPRPLIPGFEFGISLMQPNERALFLIPSSQAYRESAGVVPTYIINDLIEDAIIPDYVSSIPPYRTLIFDILRVN